MLKEIQQALEELFIWLGDANMQEEAQQLQPIKIKESPYSETRPHVPNRD